MFLPMVADGFCFNSLQTGKPIQSGDVLFTVGADGKVSIPFKRESLSKAAKLRIGHPIPSVYPFQFPFKRESLSKGAKRVWFRRTADTFQFPSNGKAYPKLLLECLSVSILEIVSISLQTGKPIQSSLRMSVSAVRDTRFNSLQTGKPIQRRTHRSCIAVGFEKVSIPFKRESLSKAKDDHGIDAQGYFVSIPFKRVKPIQSVFVAAGCGSDESFNSLQTGKPIQSWWQNGSATAQGPTATFQFPSNGESLSKVCLFNPFRRDCHWVSIPFKRESLSKGRLTMDIRPENFDECFNSPSNGKAYPKSKLKRVYNVTRSKVSIPFKRESLSKDADADASNADASNGFNSLQTGKPYPKWGVIRVFRPVVTFQSFNSLQTGKPIQRRVIVWLRDMGFR